MGRKPKTEKQQSKHTSRNKSKSSEMEKTANAAKAEGLSRKIQTLIAYLHSLLDLLPLLQELPLEMQN